MADDWAGCDAGTAVVVLSEHYHFSRANGEQLLRDQGILLPIEVEGLEVDGWGSCEAEAALNALSERYHFSRNNATQMLRDRGILRPRGYIDDEDAEDAEEWEDVDDDEEPVVIPAPGQDLIAVVGPAIGTRLQTFRDGAAAVACFVEITGLLRLPGGRVLIIDSRRIRMLSADLQQVSTVAGDGEQVHRDGAAAQAQFHYPSCLALLPDGRVLVTDQDNHRIRMLSADLQQVSTVAGNGEWGQRDGASAQAQFREPTGLALLPDGRLLVSDLFNHRIRVLSADLQQVSTVAGDGERGHRDGAAAQAQFHYPTGLALLPDTAVCWWRTGATTASAC